jgi:release factor glutamine methyltransferase
MNSAAFTVSDYLKLATNAFSVNCESARLDAEVLLCEVLGRSRAFIYTYDDYCLSEAEQALFSLYVQRRALGEPVAYIIEKREFWSLMLNVGPETLIPRPDTETLVSLALELCTRPDARVLDLGTGTGAIALALASEKPGWHIQAVDRVQAAVALAERNRASLGFDNVSVFLSHWFDQIGPDLFDIIVSNPPYIDLKDTHLFQGDVAFEPETALVAAESGLADLFYIINTAVDYLESQGWLIVEHGFEQGAAVRQHFALHDYVEIHTVLDLSQNERVTAGRRATRL